jgi:hypothetical protein
MRSIKDVRWKLWGMGVACTLMGAAIGGGTAMAYQGHMWNALSDLQAAQSQLSVARADKGGHRDNAINLVSQAISEVRAGIAYAQ